MTDSGHAPVGGTSSPLRDALERLRLRGAIFFRAEFTESWAYESPPAELISLLHPGAKRLILFHIVASGRCWVAVDGAERHWASQGDVIVLPYGDQYSGGGVEPAACVPLVELLPPPPWNSPPVLCHGTGGVRTDVVCGYLHCDDPLFEPGVRAFPRVFVVRPPDGPAARWVEASINYALARTSESLPDPPASTRLPELLLIEVLRLHLATAPAAQHGWIASLRDPVLAPAMAHLHSAPDHPWTVGELAASVSVSRSVLDERFRQVLGRSPIRYLTEWRMHIAEDLLASTHAGIAAVARQVGYQSEEAFSRAFSRSHGCSPSVWRIAQRIPQHQGSVRS